jgi:superfamily I DNA/RNA helicase
VDGPTPEVVAIEKTQNLIGKETISPPVLLVVTYTRGARRDLRNVCRAHEESVVRQFGRAALLSATEFGAFQALRLREKHGLDVQLERVRPFESEDVPAHVREAARAYEDREVTSTPYRQFASGRDLPTAEQLRGEEL